MAAGGALLRPGGLRAIRPLRDRLDPGRRFGNDYPGRVPGP